MRTFLDFSDRFELVALDRKNRQKPVKIKKPSPLDNTIWKFISKVHSPDIGKTYVCFALIKSVLQKLWTHR